MIAVIDYDMGNVRSVLNALEHIGVEAELTRDPERLAAARGLVLPGVGAFGECMRRLRGHDLDRHIADNVAAGKPLLGICVGFQMLMRSSCELGMNDGLGLFAHDVVRIPTSARLPHFGWAAVDPIAGAEAPPKLLRGLEGEQFYFVHSFGVPEPAEPVVGGLATYGDCRFLAMIERDNVFATQFHPEKSGEVGLEMLRNYADLCR